MNFGRNNTYKAIRIFSKSYNLYYATWCTNEHELYNLTSDSYQLTNLYPLPSTTFPAPHPLARLITRLDALLLILKSCQGQSCVEPWRSFHAAGDVRTLEDAMQERYDGFYARVAAEARVEFRECAMGYLREVEGPEYGGLGGARELVARVVGQEEL